jgi:hypothetical protein
MMPSQANFANIPNDLTHPNAPYHSSLQRNTSGTHCLQIPEVFHVSCR